MGRDRPSFTERIRQEVGRDIPSRACDRRAELAAIGAIAGSLHLRGGDDGSTLRIEIRLRSGAAARTTFGLLQRQIGPMDRRSAPDDRPEVAVHSAGGMRTRSSYVVSVESGAHEVGRSLGMLDHDGRPLASPPRDLFRGRCDSVAFVRGALLAAGSVSAPSRPAHLEIGTRNEAIASVLSEALEVVSNHDAAVSRRGETWRVVMKSAEGIGVLLGEIGATDAYLQWHEQRFRRELRAEATRLVNADAANVRRATHAAADQVRVVQRALAAVDWEELTPPLQQVALARLANPEASLAELGNLCDPPVGKSAVHRRLARLEEIAAQGTT